jgi:2,5-diketo-D-gluconate reductase B
MTAGTAIPRIGFGTFGRTGTEGIDAILYALETGYRHLDTAQSYDTEFECGEALARSGLKRNQVFVTTKVTGENCRPGRLVASLERSRDTLKLDRLDLALIHWPVGPGGRYDMGSYLDQLADAQSRGITGLIGVSNFTIEDLDAVEKLLGPKALATNQFERHPYLQNRKLVDYCAGHNIAVTCYLPLARGACAGDPVLEAIGKRYVATAHQIALAYSLTQGHVVIPTSGSPDRIEENFAAQDIHLTPDELAAIDARERNGRQVNPVWSPQWD